MTARSMKAPGSPSSALQIRYFVVPAAPRANFHFLPVGKPPPPRPRNPLDFHDVARLLRSQRAERTRQGAVAAPGDVLVNARRIDDPAVGQHPARSAEQRKDARPTAARPPTKEALNGDAAPAPHWRALPLSTRCPAAERLFPRLPCGKPAEYARATARPSTARRRKTRYSRRRRHPLRSRVQPSTAAPQLW